MGACQTRKSRFSIESIHAVNLQYIRRKFVEKSGKYCGSIGYCVFLTIERVVSKPMNQICENESTLCRHDSIESELASMVHEFTCLALMLVFSSGTRKFSRKYFTCFVQIIWLYQLLSLSRLQFSIHRFNGM